MSVARILAVILGSGLLTGMTPLSAAPLPTATMLADTCAGCHGTDGASAGPATPSIAGMSATYIVESMKAFRSGERPGTIMGRLAKGYSDEEFELMAQMFAKQPVALTRQKTDAARVAAGGELYVANCKKCHEQNGRLAEDDAGILASQWLLYLQYSMEDFRSGSREMTKKMKNRVDALNDAEIDALLNFFASQQ